jgi:hypothetical protein
MNIICPDGWTNLSEFSILETCSIPIIANIIIKSIEVIFGFLSFIIGIGLIYHRSKIILKKARYTIVLIVCSVGQNLIMSIRPFISLTIGVYSHNSLIMAYVTHISGIGAATVIILGIYLESRIIEKSSMTSNSSILAAKKEIILSIVWAIQTIMFLIGPVISKYVKIRYGIMFWSTVVMIDFTSIPYYCVMGTLIYRKVIQMQHDNFLKVSKRVLFTIVLLGSVGLSTGITGIYLAIDDQYEWVLTEICWIANMIVNITIFSVLAREKARNG